jgi:hypothetical protein
LATAELRLFADYHQIHLFDEQSASDLGDAWGGEATGTGLATAGDALAVGTIVNVDVSVSVQALDQPPTYDVASFDHVVEGSIHVPSGRLVVMGCTDYEPEARRFNIPAGWIRVRASRSNLAVAGSLGIESDNDPTTMERILLQLWPAPAGPTVLLKRWTPQQA